MRRAVFKAFLLLAVCGTAACSSSDGTDDARADTGLSISCEGKHTGDPCGENGICIEPSDGGSCYPACETKCWPTCDTVYSNCMIGDTCDGVCYPMAGTRQINVCFSPGSRIPEAPTYCGDLTTDPCRHASNAGCPDGSTCLDNGDGSSCWKLCTVQTDCVMPEECFDTTLGFSVCYQTELPPRLKVGEICVRTSECVDGASCVNRGGTKRCYEVCTDTCTNGTCTDIGMDYNICLVDTSDGGGQPD